MTYFSKKLRLSNLGSFSTETHITNPKREMNPNNSNIFSFFNILRRHRTYQHLLKTYFNKFVFFVKRKMLSTLMCSLGEFVRQGVMDEKKLLSTIFMKVIHKDLVNVNRAYAHDLQDIYKSYPQFENMILIKEI